MLCCAALPFQLCRSHWASSDGVMVSNVGASHPKWQKPGMGEGDHEVEWRDVYDVGVRWRQVADPYDPVFFFDGMTAKGFEEGLLLQTHILYEQQRVYMYYPQVTMALCVSWVASCRVVSCRVVSCRVVSCRVVSCRVV
jgi:hypothetical protein